MRVGSLLVLGVLSLVVGCSNPSGEPAPPGRVDLGSVPPEPDAGTGPAPPADMNMASGGSDLGMAPDMAVAPDMSSPVCTMDGSACTKDSDCCSGLCGNSATGRVCRSQDACTPLTTGMSSAGATLIVDVAHHGALVSPQLYGAFFEEINHAGDGGIYAELVRNRAFKDAATPDHWSLVTTGAATGAMALDATMPINAALPQSLRVDIQTVGA